MLVDQKLIRIVFQNLITNSIKYTPDNERITVRLKKSVEFAQFEVEDNGFGIPAAQQEQIFSKLFRADNIRNKDTDWNARQGGIETFGGINV